MQDQYNTHDDLTEAQWTTNSRNKVSIINNISNASQMIRENQMQIIQADYTSIGGGLQNLNTQGG